MKPVCETPAGARDCESARNPARRSILSPPASPGQRRSDDTPNFHVTEEAQPELLAVLERGGSGGAGRHGGRPLPDAPPPGGRVGAALRGDPRSDGRLLQVVGPERPEAGEQR